MWNKLFLLYFLFCFRKYLDALYFARSVHCLVSLTLFCLAFGWLQPVIFSMHCSICSLKMLFDHRRVVHIFWIKSAWYFKESTKQPIPSCDKRIDESTQNKPSKFCWKKREEALGEKVWVSKWIKQSRYFVKDSIPSKH